MIYFVGAGAGAPDLITVRGARLLGEADVIVYAGSLVNPALLDYKKRGCAVYDSARMTLEEVIAVMAPAARAGQTVVRLHTGDPCVYGAHREQMDALDRLGLDYEVCPGVSSFCGAAAALRRVHPAERQPDGYPDPHGRAHARAGKRADRSSCRAWRDHGGFPIGGAARKAVPAAARGRLRARHAGGDRLQGDLAG